MRLSTYSVEDWITGMVEEIEGVPIGDGSDENERLPRRCLSLRDRLSIQTLRNMITQLGEEYVESYEDAMNGVSCTNETVAYKLIKKSTRVVQPSGQRENKLLQTFYFPNTSKESVIKFVDTQVKYNKDYRYEVYAIALVYGSRLRCRTIGALIEPTVADSGQHLEGTRDVPYVSPHVRYNVQKSPYIKMVEYPVYSTAFKNAVRIGTQFSPGPRPFITAGTSLQDVKILDHPPMPPEFNLYPYTNEPTKTLIVSQPGQGSFRGPDAVPFISFSTSEAVRRDELGKYQNKFENYQLRSPDLEFKTESSSEIRKMEIFRTTEPPTGEDNLYSNFGSTAYRVLDTSSDPEVPEAERSETFDFCDTLQPNLKYYYAARAVDVHQNYSNPSAIYEVELVYNSGIYFPVIKLFEGVSEPSRTVNRGFARFLQVEAADIQTMVSYKEENGMTIGKKGFIEDSSTDVRNNEFLIRLTSRDTGRKVDFHLVFKETSKSTDDE